MALMDGTAGTHENDKLDAAVITVSTLTGFLATRVVLEQKVQLKFEGFEGWIEADRLVDKLKKAIQSQGLGRGFLSIKTDTFDEHDRQRGYLMKGTPEVRDGRALDLRAYAITGRAGGQMASGLDLHKAMLSEPAKDLVAQLLESSYKQFNAPGEGAGTSDSMYKERGAYYGVYDDQVTDKCGFISTTRRLIDTTDGGEGARWNSRLARAGLIHTDKQRQQPVTAPSFGSFETPKVERWAAGEGKDDRVVGSCHGHELGHHACPAHRAVGDSLRDRRGYRDHQAGLLFWLHHLHVLLGVPAQRRSPGARGVVGPAAQQHRGQPAL